jgi:MazG family protein
MHPATLKAIIDRLRAPGGCPWDREQTHQSLARFLKEECAEVLDAVAGLDGSGEADARLREELGDLWLQVVFHACLASERGAFDIHDAEKNVVEKLLRRHPHVFASSHGASAASSGEVLAAWDAIKAAEKAGGAAGLLDGIPPSLSSLDEAAEIGRLCEKAGFDWPNCDGVLEKVKEEIAELSAESFPGRVEEEFGDVLFSLVQWARHKKIDPDLALRRQLRRFRQRFRAVEDCAMEAGGWESASLEDMESAWQAAKAEPAGYFRQ